MREDRKVVDAARGRTTDLGPVDIIDRVLVRWASSRSRGK